MACAAVVGCAARQPRTPDAADRPGPTPTPTQFHTRLAAHNAALSSFQGQGRLFYEGPDGKLRSANMVVVKAPDKVRIDFRSPFSLTYTVVTDGSELVAYDRGEKVLYRGQPTPRNLGRYTRVPVDLEMLALLVRGIPPLPHGAGEGTVRPVEAGWLWEVPLDHGALLSIEFAAPGLQPRKAKVEGARGGNFSAFFDDYGDVSGVDAAHEIRAELPDGGTVQLTYGVIWRDRTHSDNAFTLEAPSGVRVVDMDE